MIRALRFQTEALCYRIISPTPALSSVLLVRFLPMRAENEQPRYIGYISGGYGLRPYAFSWGLTK